MYDSWEEDWDDEDDEPVTHSRWYDSRMNPVDNWRFLYWRPFVCKVRGHKITCYKVVGENPYFVYICHRCMDMTDYVDPCGQCTNHCRKD